MATKKRSLVGGVSVFQPPTDRGPVVFGKRGDDKDTFSDYKYAVGLDLGTTRSAAAFAIVPRNGDPQANDFFTVPAAKLREDFETSKDLKHPTIVCLKIGKGGKDLKALTEMYLINESAPDAKQEQKTKLKARLSDDKRMSIGSTQYRRIMEKLVEADDDDKKGNEAQGADTFVAADFKMHLDLRTRQQEKSERVLMISTEMIELPCCRSDSPPLQISLLDLNALYIRYVAEVAFDALCEAAKSQCKPIPESLTDCTWSVTVPAIFRDQARMFMRQAATRAGLLSNDSSKLRICLEPEGAGLDCFAHIAYNEGREDFLSKDESVIVVDLGGGTADISVQKVETYSKKTQVVQFSEAHPPTGGPWGGRLVNYAFEDRVLRPFLGKEKFAEYKRSPLRFLFMQPFERMKTAFSGEESVTFDALDIAGEFNVDESSEPLPDGVTYTSRNSKRGPKKNFNLSAQFMSSLFETALTSIIDHLASLLTGPNPPVTVKAAFVVGGMSANPYVNTRLGRFFETSLPKVRFYCPDGKCHMAIALGAARFGLDEGEGSFGARIARASYGPGVYNRADPANPLFNPIVFKGQSLKDVEMASKKKPFGPYSPVTEDQTAVRFAFFETDEEEGSKNMPKCLSSEHCTFVAKTHIKVDTSLPFEEREYWVHVSLSGPTISAFVIKPDGSEEELSWQTR